MKKLCTKCGRMLDLSEFHKNKTTKDGLCYWCKECKSKYYKERNAELKREIMIAFGGRCTHVDKNGVQCSKNAKNNLKELDIIHPNGDGDAHRKLISHGRYGDRFYGALKNLGYDTGKFVVKVMCKTHHYRFDNIGKKHPMYGKYGKSHYNYKDGKFNDPVWLKERYVNDKMSLQEIADLCGVSQQTILNRMIKFNIDRRKPWQRP